MKASRGFFALAALGLAGLSPAHGQTVQPAPLATMTPGGSYGVRAAATEAPAAAPATAATTPVAAGGTSPQNLVAYSSAFVDGPYIAITFDDGPNPETTPRLLKMLEARGIKATFFVLGSRATAAPAIVRQMVAQGHEVANHSWDHPQLPKLSVAAVDKQISGTNAAIEQITGKPTKLVRPPYGAMTNPLRAHLREKYGSTFVYWSVDPLDWKDRNPQLIHDRIVSRVHSGAIILVHDIHPTTVDAMPKTLDDLLAKGYKFVTVSEIIAMNKAMPEPKVAVNAPAQPKKKPKPAKPAAAPATKPAAAPAAAKPGTPAATPAASSAPVRSAPASAPRPPASVGLF